MGADGLSAVLRATHCLPSSLGDMSNDAGPLSFLQWGCVFWGMQQDLELLSSLPVSKRLSQSRWGSSCEFTGQPWRKTWWAVQSHGCSQWHGVLPSPLHPASNDFRSFLPDGRSWGRKPPFQAASSPPAQALLPQLNSVNQNICSMFGP